MELTSPILPNNAWNSAFTYFLVALGLYGIWIKWSTSSILKKKLPPSPFQFPLLGCLPFLGSLPHEAFARWAKKLGKIYSCRLGGKTVIVLNSSDLIREALSQPVLSGRPHMYTAEVTAKGHGISFASDDTWSIHRRFAFKTFRTLGAGQGKMEEQIQAEIENMVESIGRLNGEKFCNNKIIRTTVGSMIAGVLFGERFDLDDPKTHAFFDKMNAVFRFFGPCGVLNIFPFLRHIPSVAASFEKVKEALDGAAQYINCIIKDRDDCLDKRTVCDYTDAFLNARNKEKELYGKPKLFTDQQYVGAARELFLTGYDTTTSTLRWAFLYIARNTEAQAKIQREVDEVVGSARLPNYADLKKMPYTQAAICEAQRLASIAPLSIPHRAITDTELCGYFIPKDAWVFTNMWYVHHDESKWQNASEFRPERFLSVDGKDLILPSDFIPYSIGKRSCPGETLAKMALFLIFTTVLQRFKLTVENPENVDMSPVNGITLDTKEYLLTAVPRN